MGRNDPAFARAGSGREFIPGAVAAALESSLVCHFPLKGGSAARVGTGSLEVSRASNAVQGDGVSSNIVTVGNNVARYGALGMVIEESRTNLVEYSEDSDNWLAQGGITTTKDYGIAPDGQPTSALITISSISPYAFKGAIVTPSASTTHTQSVYLKGTDSSVGKVIDVLFYDAVATAAKFVCQHTLTSEWVRVSCGGTVVSGNTGYAVVGHATAIGGASDLEVGDAFEMWGLQLEEGIGSTSYIKTTGTAATRAGDWPSINAANMPAYSSDMSIAMTVSLFSDASNYHGLWAAEGETTREGDIDNGTAKLIHFIPSTDASTGTAITHGTPVRYCLTYDADGNWVAYLNGVQDDTAAVGSISGTLTSVTVGASSGGSYPLHGHLSLISIYNKALTSAEVGLDYAGA